MEKTKRDYPIRYVIFGRECSGKAAAIYRMEKEHGVTVLEGVNTPEDLAAAEEDGCAAIATNSYTVAAIAMRKGAVVLNTNQTSADFIAVPVFVNLADLASGDMETVRAAITSALYPVMQAIFEAGGEYRAGLHVHGHHMAQKACEKVVDMWAEAAVKR